MIYITNIVPCKKRNDSPDIFSAKFQKSIEEEWLKMNMQQHWPSELTKNEEEEKSHLIAHMVVRLMLCDSWLGLNMMLSILHITSCLILTANSEACENFLFIDFKGSWVIDPRQVINKLQSWNLNSLLFCMISKLFHF